MSVLIYKQRFYPVNESKTPTNNYYYIRYIATRDGVEMNDTSNHGLWGKIGSSRLTEFDSWEKIASKVRYLSENGTNIYRSVLSFSSQTAYKLGLKTNKDWQDYIASQMYIIARENNISIMDLEYCVAHHNKENQHVHIVFWDKNQKIQTNFIKPEKVDDLRRKLIKSTFADELEKIYLVKNFSRKEIRSLSNELIDEFGEILKSNHLIEFKDIVEEIVKNQKNIFVDYSEHEYFHTVAKKYIEVLQMLPQQKGSIDYDYLNEEIKNNMDELVDLMITHFSGINKSYHNYLEATSHIDQMYSLEDNIKAHDKDIRKYVANGVLKSYRTYLKGLKQLNENEYSDSRYMNKELKEKYAMNHLLNKSINDMAFGLSSLIDGLAAERNNENCHNYIDKNLSIFARRELFAKNKDRNMER